MSIGSPGGILPKVEEEAVLAALAELRSLDPELCAAIARHIEEVAERYQGRAVEAIPDATIRKALR
jgi:hypothetical protein